MNAYTWNPLLLCLALIQSSSLSPVTHDANVPRSGSASGSVDTATVTPDADSSGVEIKRGWRDNTMQVWGKRTGLPVDPDRPESDPPRAKATGAEDAGVLNENSLGGLRKRKWRDNTMQVWGKRGGGVPKSKSGGAPRGALNGKTAASGGEVDMEKRRWGENSMAVWGKRAREPSVAADKRKWGENSMSVWGKRSEGFSPSDVGLVGINAVKRKWSDNSMSVWGKRSLSLPSADSSATDELKRKWGQNSMGVWGKRSGSDQGLSDTWAPSSPPSDQSLAQLLKCRNCDDEFKSTGKAGWGDKMTRAWRGKRSTENNEARNPTHSVSRRSLEDDEEADEELVRPSAGDVLRSLLARRHTRALDSWGGPKRNWETNTMRVWGKRGWTNRANVPVWGKRSLGGAVSWRDALLEAEEDFEEEERRAWERENRHGAWS